MTNPNDLVGKALIKYTEQELDLILMALKSITSLKIPVKEEGWKKPFKKLYNDLLVIRRNITEKKNQGNF
jgi:hypothetical protein